jgi:hypothetical protein
MSLLSNTIAYNATSGNIANSHMDIFCKYGGGVPAESALCITDT